MRWFVSIGLSLLIAVTTVYATQQDAEQEAQTLFDSTKSFYGSGEAIKSNLGNPLVSDDVNMTNISGTESFNAKITCNSGQNPSTDFLEVAMQTGSTGDITTLYVKLNKDLQGSYDAVMNVTNQTGAISGVCANGVISCVPGTWNSCKYWRWKVNSNLDLIVESVNLDQLGGCYCINNSCGSNLAVLNASVVIKDIGGGIAGAFQAIKPEYAISAVSMDPSGMSIRYAGQNMSGCQVYQGSSPSGVYNPKDDTSLKSATEQEVSVQQNIEDSTYQIAQTLIAGQNYDFKLCQIRRQINCVCPDGYQYDANTKRCYASIVCPEGGIYDPARQKCIQADAKIAVHNNGLEDFCWWGDTWQACYNMGSLYPYDSPPQFGGSCPYGLYEETGCSEEYYYCDEGGCYCLTGYYTFCKTPPWIVQAGMRQGDTVYFRIKITWRDGCRTDTGMAVALEDGSWHWLHDVVEWWCPGIYWPSPVSNMPQYTASSDGVYKFGIWTFAGDGGSRSLTSNTEVLLCRVGYSLASFDADYCTAEPSCPSGGTLDLSIGKCVALPATMTDIEDTCSEVSADPNCKLRSEKVDGVTTYKDFYPTGLVPQPVCKSNCDGSAQICDWWLKERQYFCQTQTEDFSEAKSRIKKVITTTDPNTLTYTDLRYTETGAVVESGTLVKPEAGILDTGSCRKACKTRKPVTNTTVSQYGTAAQMQASNTTYEFYYRECQNDVCPIGSGEELVKNCQCINDFAEAASIIAALDAAGKDMICSSGVKQ